MTVHPLPRRPPTALSAGRQAPGSRADCVCVLDALGMRAPIDPGGVKRRCLAVRLPIAAGSWEPPCDANRAAGWLGLLVVDGLLTRTVELDGLRSKELLGPGDLLRPWDAFADPGGPDGHGIPAWQAVQDSGVAVLDERFAGRAGRVPAITEALLRCSIRRSHSAALLLSISRARRADDRLLLLFDHLADRWGRVGVDGIRLPLRLTHQVIGELVCLRRPTVSSTLSRLRDSGRIERLADGTWRLPHPAPAGDGHGSISPRRIA